ncbi:hypothetical protein HanIR_Chr17g0896331 [Helianthus annuus]|nr:hypothetical protein HanIR_Chr17g0896331 [Helianthus annuus]
MFNDEAVKELIQRVNNLEKEKAKTELERDILKKQVDRLVRGHDQLREELIQQNEEVNKARNEAEDNSKLFKLLSAEISDLSVKIKELENVIQTLNQLLSEMSEASSNEMKAMKLEMEAMKADKVMKDQQLQMLVAVVKSHLKMNIHAAFEEIDVIKANERRMERERRLAEEVTQKNKGVVEEVEVTDGLSSQLDVGGSSSQPHIEMIEVVEVQEQEIVEDDQEMVEAKEVQEPGFMIVGEPSEPIDINNVLRRVKVIQRKRRATEVLLLEWKTSQFVLVGDAYPVPYSGQVIARQMKVKERRRQAMKARGEIVDDDSDDELFGDEEEEDEDKDDDKADDKLDDKDDKDDDDNYQGASGLLIRDPGVQEKIDQLMNDEINEQEDEVQNEASSSGKQPVDQVLLTNPTVFYLNVQQEAEVVVRRTRAEMLEELGLEEGRFKFDIEDEIPQSPVKDFESRYPHDADHYDDVIIKDASDSEEDEIEFHYDGIDASFPTFAEMFKDKNEDEIKRKIVKKISTEGVPETIPREILAEEKKKWFKNMPKERKTLRALQFFTHNKNLSWGDILSWGYLEDLKVYAIRREEGVQYFEFLSDIASLPWWDVDELVKTKNIKQFYYGPEVREHNQELWNYIKLQAKNDYPDWKPQFPKQIVRYLENGEKDITLDIKPPKCLKNMPLRAIEQDFYDLFQGWLFNPSTMVK